MRDLLLLLVALLPLSAGAAWTDSSGKPTPDTESMRSVGDFGAQLVLTPDEKQFRRSWSSTKGTPTLRATNSARRGGAVAAMIVFHGCVAKAGGACEVTVDFKLQGPDGKQAPAGGGPVWTGEPAQAGMLRLGQASMTVRFDATDPFGNYRVLARVTDKASGRTLDLAAPLLLGK